MAERKFGALQGLRKQQSTATVSIAQSIAPQPDNPVETIRGRGRPAGKRSDPEFQPTTVLLRKQTKKAATRLLEDRDTGQDLSELIEQLLKQWIQKL